MASQQDDFIKSMFFNSGNQPQQQNGFQYRESQMPQEELLQEEPQPVDEQGIIADFIDKVQGGAWGAAADTLTGARGLLTDDKVWEMEQYLRDQVSAQQDTLSQAQKEADANFSMFGEGDFTGRGLMGAVGQGIGSIGPSMLAGGGLGLAGRGLAALGGAGKAGQAVGGAMGAGAAGAPLIGGGSMNQIREELDAMPAVELSQLPDFDMYYQQALQQSPDDPQGAMAQAREAYTTDAEQTAVQQGAMLGGASMAVAGPFLEKLVKGGYGVREGAKVGGITEFGQEAVESGGQEAIVNPLAGREVMEGVPVAALEGGILGGVVGGGLGGTTGVFNRAPEEQSPEFTGPQPFTGPEQQVTQLDIAAGGGLVEPVTAVNPPPPVTPMTDKEQEQYDEWSPDTLYPESDLNPPPPVTPLTEREKLEDEQYQANAAEAVPVEQIEPEVDNIPKPTISILRMNANELKGYQNEIDEYKRGAPESDTKAIDEIQNRLDILQSRAKEPVDLIKGTERDITTRRAARGVKPEPTRLDEKATEAATHPDNELPEPTHAQQEAGNYKKVHDTVQGMKVSIENPKGSTRKGVDKDGKDWSVDMNDHYGYFKGTTGYDKDHLDTFMGPGAETAESVYVVDQVTPSTGKFDEHKVMMGYDNIQDAEQAYLRNYSEGWQGLDNITEMPLNEFKEWAYSDAPKKGALAPKKTEQDKTDVTLDKESEITPERDRDTKPAEDKTFKETKPITKEPATGVEPEKEPLNFDDVKKFTDKELKDQLNKAGRLDNMLGDRATEEQENYRKALIKEDYARSKATKDDAMAPEAPVAPPVETAPPKPKPKKAKKKPLPGTTKATDEEVKAFKERQAAPTQKLIRAQNKFDKDMAELGGAIFEVLSMKVIPSDRKPEFTRLLTNVMGSALNLGYVKFAENAKHVLDVIGEKFGKDAADLFDLQMLQGAYLGATSGEKGAQGITEVASVTMDDINKTEVDKNVLLPDDTARVPEASKGKRDTTKKPSGRVPPKDKQRKRTGGATGTTGKPTQFVGPTTAASRKPSDRSGATEYQGGSRADLQHNYRIESQEDLAKGSAYVIAKSNLDAIKIAKRIASSDNDTALPEEKATLAKYAGWGASEIRNKVFPKNNKPEGRWKEIYNQLGMMLTPAEMKTLKKSTQYAHYTSKSVVDAMYQAIDGFGFQAGSVFEGGVGSGNFMGLIPEKFKVPNYTGIEMDSISADIAQALYTDNRVIKGDFTKIKLPDNHFDLVIGNPPFADVKYKLNGESMMLHDYMIAKQLDALRPGQVGAFVTSTGTMDKVDSSVREYIDNGSVLLGAIRLPNDAFKASAGTGVTTDILFFQKRDSTNDSIKGVNWIDTGVIKTADGDTSVNLYFKKNPIQMLGTPGLGGTFQNRFDLKSNGDTQEQLNKAIDNLPKDVITDHPTVEEINARDAEVEIAPAESDSYFYLDKNGIQRINQGGLGVVVENRKQHGRGKTAKQMEMIKDYIPLRDALMKVMKSQGNDAVWNKAVKELNTQYDSFTGKHGPLNKVNVTKNKNGVEAYRSPIISALEDDAEFYRVLTTEQYNDVTGEGTKGDVFTDKLFGQEIPVEINSAEDAMAVTLNEKGYLDMDYMQEVYNKSEKEIISELGESVFSDPLTGQQVTSDEYLSGNVKAKLRQAEEAGIKRNIDALKAVIPEDKPLSEIPINLGAFWISTDTIKRFAEEKLDFTGRVSNVIRGETSSWSVIGTAENTADFGTAERTPVQILDATLNRKTVKVTYKDNDGKTIVKVAESAAANEKVKALRDAFSEWAVNDQQASEELHEVYNRDFNTTVPRQYDGDILTLPGLSSKYALHKWQKDVVWRIIQNGNTYMAHAVGSGKTLASIVAGMELKRLGLAQKPAYAVLKSTLKQFSAEFYDAYPNAKLLIADENQLNARNRRHFMGKVANENWDAVILTHQTFTKVPMGEQFQTEYIEAQIAEYEATLEEMDEQDLPNRRNIENAIERMAAQLSEIAAGADKDKGVTFEDSGIDQLFVDEAHKHKKVQFPTTQNDMKGIDSTGSKIAMDLFLKSRYLNTMKPNKNMVMMSGTAVTNTINEFYNIQRYLQPDVLAQQGISSFDAWSSTFAESTTNYEMKANGEFQPVTRLNKFVGLPGFLRDFLQVADIVGDKQLEESTTIKNRPTLKNNSRDIVAVPIGESMKEYMQELDARIKALENKKGPPKKGEDNILVVMNDGQNAAIDMRLVNKTNDVPSKLDVMIDDAFQSWEEMSDAEYTTNGETDPIKGNVQLIFTKTRKSSKSPFDVYDHIKNTLIAKGVPASEIAFIQDYGDSKKKKRLFDDVNNGKVRFVLGGTENLGTGTNVQKRLSKIHHLSIDYRPADLKQREGRAIRQGNQNEEVESIAYAAEGTIDAFMWGMLESKAAMIDNAMSGDLSINSISDVADDQSMLAMAKAIASGNPALLEIAELAGDVKRLGMMESSYTNQRFNARKTLRDVERSKKEIAYWEAETKNLPAYKETSGDKFNAELLGKKYTERVKFLDALNALPKQKPGPIGKVGNQEIFIDNNKQITFNEGNENVYVQGSTFANSYLLDISPVKLTGSLSTGAVVRMENTARKYVKVPADMKEESKKVNKREENADRIIESEFDKTEELNTKRERLMELEESLKTPAPEPETKPDDADYSKPGKKPVEHPDFSFTGVSKPEGLSERQIFNIINDTYGRPMFGASKFKNVDIINDPNSKWRGKYQGGKITLNAYYMTKQDAVRILQHEKVHEYIKKDTHFRKIANDIIRRAKKNPDSAAGKALEIAKNRVSKDVPDYNRKIFEETMAYLVQYYNQPEVKGIFKRVADVIAKFFRAKLGIKMNESDAVNYLKDMVKAEAAGTETEQKDYKQQMDDIKAGKYADVEEIEYSALGDAISTKAAAAFENETWANLKSSAKSQAWGVLNVRQIADVLGKYLPQIKSKYIDRFKLFEADMNEMKQNAGDIAMKRQKLSKEENEDLARVQHTATVEGYDPSFEQPDAMMGEDNDIPREPEDIAKRERIKEEYDGLSGDAKGIYSEERDYHKDMHDARLEQLTQRIKDIEADEGFKTSMIEKLHAEFNQASKSGPYFPLARFGQYWVSGTKNGEKFFEMFENEASQKRFVEETRAAPGEEVNGFGKKLDELRGIEGVSGQFIADVDKLVRTDPKNKLQEKISDWSKQRLRDDIFQLYLESLPELSARKKYLHRGKVAGYAKDQSRAFAQKARADANDIARLKHIHILQKMIEDSETTLNIASSDTLKQQFNEHAVMLQDALDSTPFELTDEDVKALNKESPFKVFNIHQTGNPEAEIERILNKEKQLLADAEKIKDDKIIFVANGLNELKKSHQAMVNNEVHPVASGLNSLGFLWYLGASPAAAIVNLTQTPTISLPMMLANKSFKNSARHLVGALKDFMAGRGSIESQLNAEELKAFREWHRSGLLENTQAHDLSGVADSGIDTGTFKNKAMRMMSFMFHRAEVMNRQVTALAAYRAARDGGSTPKEAMKKASDLTWESHLDYGASNRARFMRGNFARVITQFKQYSQGVTYIYAKTLIQAIDGESKEDRQAAMKLFGMLIGSQITVAGTLGLPMAGVVMGIAQGLTDAFDDEDDATSVKAEFRQAMSDLLGKTGGQAISHGLIDTLTPLSMSGRLSMADLWVRTPDFDQEGKAEALSYIEALGGPMVSIFTNMFMAKQSFQDGNYLRAAEQMTPKIVKDFARAGRYATEGNLTKAGLKVKDMTPAEMIAQALGFSSSEVSEIRERATQIKNIEKQRTTRRSQIIKNWMNSEDRDMTEIQAWNKKYPRDRITGKTLRTARKSKMRYAKQYVGGVRQTKRNRDLMEEYDY